VIPFGVQAANASDSRTLVIGIRFMRTRYSSR
jgi:hypothetical protein